MSFLCFQHQATPANVSVISELMKADLNLKDPVQKKNCRACQVAPWIDGPRRPDKKSPQYHAAEIPVRKHTYDTPPSSINMRIKKDTDYRAAPQTHIYAYARMHTPLGHHVSSRRRERTERARRLRVAPDLRHPRTLHKAAQNLLFSFLLHGSKHNGRVRDICGKKKR